VRSRLFAVAAVAALLAVSLVDAPFPRDQRLQHIPTVVALGLLGWAARRCTLTAAAFYGLLGFLVLHVVGARWVYSNVPYDRWGEAAFGVRLSERFGWERNHYDRLVHLAFGAMAMPAAVDLFRFGGCRPGLAVLGGLSVVTAASGVYEIVEWGIAMLFSPDQAEAYNGQQGDLWDAQKDMALALAGSVFVGGVMVVRSDRTGSE